MSLVGPVQPPRRLRRFSAARVVLHPVRAARVLALLADTGHEADLMYRVTLRTCVVLHLGPLRR